MERLLEQMTLQQLQELAAKALEDYEQADEDEKGRRLQMVSVAARAVRQCQAAVEQAFSAMLTTVINEDPALKALASGATKVHRA